MSGSHFRDYHLLLDEQAEQIFATTDAIAERVRKVGGTTRRSVECSDLGLVGRPPAVGVPEDNCVPAEVKLIHFL